MGSTKSKLSVLSFEDAEKRLSDKELNRLKRAFSQIAPKGTLNLEKFYLEVFGEFVPFSICETLFNALKIGTYSNGINFKELLIGITILTGGSYEEKCKFIFSLYCNETGTGIEHSTLQGAVDNISDVDDLRMVRNYLDENSILSFEKFMKWIEECPKFNEMTYWLLLLDCPHGLTDNSSPLDLYQLVAGVTHLEETEIIELEKTYNKLVASLPQRSIDFDGFSRIITVQLPEKLVKKVFLTFDENEDGSIDLKELACGISACTRGPMIERKKFCCKIFDDNRNGKLSGEDVESIFSICNEIKNRNVVSPSSIAKVEKPESTCYLDLLNSILSSNEMVTNMSISIDDFLIWMNDYDFIDPLLDLLNQIFTVIFNVRPQSGSEEEQIISRWLRREEKFKIDDYDGLYLISRSWLKQWLSHIRAIKKDSMMNSISNESRSDPRVSYSKSMNNVLHFPKKHQYDLTKSNKLPPRVKSNDEIIGRYTLHTSINGGLNTFDNIYPDFASRGDFCNYTGSNTSISSFSSNSSFQDILPSTKLIPINNQDLLNVKMPPAHPDILVYSNDGGILDNSIKLGEDFELLPSPIWNCLVTWYGGGPSLFRPAWVESRSDEMKKSKIDDNCIILNRNKDVLKIEIHLLTLFVMRHVTPATSSARNVVATINKLDLPAISTVTESVFTPSSLNSQKSVLGNVAVSKRQIRGRISFSRRSTLNKLIEFLSVKLNINKDEMRIWKVVDDTNLVLLDDEEKLLHELELDNSDKILVEQRNIDLTWPEELNQLAKIRSLQNKKASSFKGITGLSNIGNTCFFNSALQCISNTNVLTDYFIRDIHLCELNRTNAQGCNGMVALRYAELMKDIWAGSSNLIVPLKLKMTIDQYVHQFSENQQHDAQEFLSALLDSLHEDLNRVKEKPRYKELKDSDGRCDEEVADEAWQCHIESNQSIIVDLFHGLLRSNVCCNICKNNSVRFDAYSMLSLPIPMQTNREIDLLVFYRDSPVPRKHCVVVNSIETTPSFIRNQLAKQLLIAPRKLLLALVEDDKIKKLINRQDKVIIGHTIYVYVVGDDDNEDTSQDSSDKFDNMKFDEEIVFVIYHRRMIQRTDYFMAHSRMLPETFSYPVVFTVKDNMMSSLTHKNIYEKVLASIDSQNQIKCFLSDSFNSNRPLHQASNHAIDCDSKDHALPFKLSRISSSGKQCNQCHWSRFCRGCILNCSEDLYVVAENVTNLQYIAIDWYPADLHLRFNPENEKMFLYHTDYKDIKSSNNQPMDLLKCIEIFTTEETLGKDTLYQCTKCKGPQPAHKKLDLWTLPPVLIIHLKRFQFLDNKWQKSHKVVRYPIRNLDLNNFIKNSSSKNESNNNNDQDDPSCCSIYNLYAVNCHLGNLQMGHYITYARNKETGNWYMYNDSICKEVNEKEVNTNSAYLLFYERANVDFETVLDELAENKRPPMEAAELISDQVDTDIKKYCIIQ